MKTDMRRWLLSILFFLSAPSLSLAGGYCVECHASYGLAAVQPPRYYRDSYHSAEYTACPVLGAIKTDILSSERALVEAGAAARRTRGLGILGPGPKTKLHREGIALMEMMSGEEALYSSGQVLPRLRQVRLGAEALRSELQRAGAESQRKRAAAVSAAAAAAALFGLWLWRRKKGRKA